MRKFLVIPATALALMLGASPALVASAQTQANPPATAAPAKPRADRIEGRLAFLKAELKITEAQTAQWNAVADVMRANNHERRAMMEQARAQRGQPTNALARLEARERFIAARMEGDRKFLAVFRPLYQSLSAEQKATADELFAGRGKHGHRHEGGNRI